MKKIVKFVIGALVVSGLLFGAYHTKDVHKNADGLTTDTTTTVTTNNIYDPGKGGGGM